MRRDCLGAMVLPMWGLCMVAGSAHAHGGPGPAQAATWFSGLVHPVLGADHLLAMLGDVLRDELELLGEVVILAGDPLNQILNSVVLSHVG